jgi:hypothetical protein
LVARGGEGTGRGVFRKRDPRSAVEAQGNLARLAPWGLKMLKRRVGCGGKARKQLPKSPFSATFPQVHRYIGVMRCSLRSPSTRRTTYHHSWCCHMIILPATEILFRVHVGRMRSRNPLSYCGTWHNYCKLGLTCCEKEHIEIIPGSTPRLNLNL